MPTPNMPHGLYPLDECPDLVADACVLDDTATLVFLSLWGRDTAVQEFLARLTLPVQQGGLDHFRLCTDDTAIPVSVAHIDKLEKFTSRTLRNTLFGSLINIWLVDPRCVVPDKVNSRALALLPRTTETHIERLWRLVKDTSPFPLMDHWRDTVLGILTAKSMLAPLKAALGPVAGYRLALDVPLVTAILGELIRTGTLGIEPLALPATQPLRKAA